MNISATSTASPRAAMSHTFAALVAGDGLRSLQDYPAAIDAYRQAARNGAAEAGDRLHNMDEDDQACAAYLDAAKMGNVDGADGLLNLKGLAAAKEAYLAAARAGEPLAGDRLTKLGETQLAQQAWQLAAQAPSHPIEKEYDSAYLMAKDNWARTQEGDALFKKGDVGGARRAYTEAVTHGSASAVNSYELTFIPKERSYVRAERAYIAVGKMGNPEAGFYLTHMGETDEAAQAYIHAAAVGGVYLRN